jgi:hypothetical protein
MAAGITSLLEPGGFWLGRERKCATCIDASTT